MAKVCTQLDLKQRADAKAESSSKETPPRRRRRGLSILRSWQTEAGRRQVAQGKLRGQSPAEGGPERIDLRTEKRQKPFTKQSSAGLAGEEVLAAASGRQTGPAAGRAIWSRPGRASGQTDALVQDDPTLMEKSAHPWLEQAEQCNSECRQEHA